MRYRAILVTGAHRSGTTWVGRMLGFSPRLFYVLEPFNIHFFPDSPARWWFRYVTGQDSKLFETYLRKNHYTLYGQIKREIGKSGGKTALGEWVKRHYLSFREGGRPVPLVKDPHGVLSAEWLSKKFQMAVIVTIRHPAAFAGSLKVKGWTHPFSHFLQSPALMKEHLYPFEEEIREFAREEKPVVDHAILLWRLIYFMVEKYRRRHPEWIFIRHEDLSRAPIPAFKSLYERLGLPWHAWIEEKIYAYTHTSEFAEGEFKYRDLVRPSEENIYSWRHRLTEEEIERVRRGTQDIWPYFYSESDWDCHCERTKLSFPHVFGGNLVRCSINSSDFCHSRML